MIASGSTIVIGLRQKLDRGDAHAQRTIGAAYAQLEDNKSALRWFNLDNQMSQFVPAIWGIDFRPVVDLASLAIVDTG